MIIDKHMFWDLKMPTKITEHIGKYNSPLEVDFVVLIQNSLDFLL